MQPYCSGGALKQERNVTTAIEPVPETAESLLLLLEWNFPAKVTHVQARDFKDPGNIFPDLLNLSIGQCRTEKTANFPAFPSCKTPHKFQRIKPQEFRTMVLLKYALDALFLLLVHNATNPSLKNTFFLEASKTFLVYDHLALY
jgi:hypothetical protein